MAESVNRAKPDAVELQQVYGSHIEAGTLLLCDGLKSYGSLKNIADCTVKDINTADITETRFYNLNTINNFHSFIKDRYNFYRGVATKYLNRYNALFALSWRQGMAPMTGLCAKLFHPSSHNFHHGINDIKGMRLLLI